MATKLLRILLVFCVFLFTVPSVIFAQSEVEARIAEYESKISELQGKGRTLANQIHLLDSQISLATLRIDTTKSQIEKLSSEIVGLNDEIDRLEDLKTKRLTLVLHRIPESYKRGQSSQFGLLLFSKNFADFIARVQYLRTVEAEDALNYRKLQDTQDQYNERKALREKKKEQSEELKKQLEQQSLALARQKKEKQALLDETKNSEATYQVLLSQAKAQLASFATFANSQGGGILTGQTSCGDWGCYYNQRDSQWGYTLINGSNDCGGACNVSRVGCLVTSVAMMASHFGRKDISPGDIATSDPSNFSVGTAMLKKGTISVKGANITRTTVAGSLSPDIVSGGPVIVGVYYGQFGTHFVVVKSYQDGKYIMNDPYTAGGHDIPFTDHYSLGSVFSVDRVSM